MCRLLILLATVCLCGSVLGVRVGPTWQSTHADNTKIEALCNHKDVNCISDKNHCVDDQYNPVKSCDIIAAFATYSQGLRVINPRLYEREDNQYVHGTTLGIFLFGKYRRLNRNFTQSVGVATYPGRNLTAGGKVFVCSQGVVNNQSRIISSVWRYSSFRHLNQTLLNVTESLYPFGNSSANQSLYNQDFYVCSWALTASEVETNNYYQRLFNVTTMDVEMHGQLHPGPRPITPGQLGIDQANGFTLRLKMGDLGPEYDTKFRVGAGSGLQVSMVFIVLMILFNKMF